MLPLFSLCLTSLNNIFTFSFYCACQLQLTILQSVDLLLEGAFVNGFKLDKLGGYFAHYFLLPIIEVLIPIFLYIAHSTNLLQFSIQKIKIIFFDHCINKIFLFASQIFQQTITSSTLIALITKIHYIFHFSVLEYSVYPVSFLHVFEAALPVEDVLMKVAFVGVVVLEDAHPVSLQHIVLVCAFLYYFELELVFEHIGFRIIASIFRCPEHKLETQALRKFLLRIFHIMNLYFVTNFANSYILYILLSELMTNRSTMALTNQHMKCLIEKNSLYWHFIDGEHFHFLSQYTFLIAYLMNGPFDKADNIGFAMKLRLLIIPQVHQIPINPIRNINNPIPEKAYRDESPISVEHTLALEL